MAEGADVIQTCPDCDERYDDVDRLTFCPHDRFPMHNFATREDGASMCCFSPAELDDFLYAGAESRGVCHFHRVLRDEPVGDFDWSRLERAAYTQNMQAFAGELLKLFFAQMPDG